VIASVLALVVCCAEGGESEPPARRAGLEVSVDIAGESDSNAILRRRILERGDVALRQAGVLPASADDDTTIAIRIGDDREESSFTFAIHTSRAGKAMADPIAGTCRLCTEGELVAAVEGRLAEVIAAIEPPAAPAPASAPAPTMRSTPRAAMDSPRPRRLGKLGIAGVSSLVAGAAIAATGIGLVLAPDRDAADPRYDISTRPAGWALVGVAGASAVVGAVLLGIDRRRARAARLAFTGGGTLVSLGMRGRF
jgi:hypothetical protein